MKNPFKIYNTHLISAPYWKVMVLHLVGKLIDQQFKIEGFPYGGAYKGERGEDSSVSAEDIDWNAVGTN